MENTVEIIEPKYRFGYHWGRRLLALVLVLALLGSMFLGWTVQIRDLGKQYVGSVLEYAAKVTQDQTAYLDQSVLERAWQVLRWAVGKPRSFEAYDTYLSLSIAQGDFEGAKPYMDGCIQTYQGNEAGLANLYLRKGTLYTLTEDFSRAEDCYTQALERNDRLAEAYLLRAQMRLELEKTAEALEDMRAYQKLSGGNPTIAAAMGSLYELSEDFENAVLCYTRAIDSGAYEVSALASRGRCSILIGRTQEGGQDLERYFQEGGEDATGDYYAMLAMCRLEGLDYTGTTRAIKAAQKRGYADVQSLYLQLIASAYLNEAYAAILEAGPQVLEYQQEQGGSPEMQADVLRWMGLSAFMLQDYAAAAGRLEQALTLDEKLPYIPYYIGIANMALGRLEQALDFFRRSAQAGEYVSVSRYNEAICLVQLERYEEAVQPLEEAILANDDAEVIPDAQNLLEDLKAFLEPEESEETEETQVQEQN